MSYNIIDLPDVDLLNREETQKYIKAAQKGDSQALDKLVKHNLKLVLKVTYRFKNYNYDLQDLFQIGVIGFIKAVKNFDLTRNLRLSTYAVSRILGEIRLFVRDEGMIKVSRSLKKIARDVRKKEEEMKKRLSRDPTINEIVEETGYEREKILQALEANKGPTSVYQTIHQEDGSKLYLIDRIKEKSGEQGIEEVDKMTLVENIKQLDERSRKIIFYRYFEDMTQQDIADKIGVSQVQISRLERKILNKLKEAL
jgi:RNA polymerase sporulation-specific sigma factor